MFVSLEGLTGGQKGTDVQEVGEEFDLEARKRGLVEWRRGLEDVQFRKKGKDGEWAEWTENKCRCSKERRRGRVNVDWQVGRIPVWNGDVEEIDSREEK